MFAQLSYPAGATIANVLNDIALTLSGSDLSALSADISQSVSTINNGPGGAATWQVVASNTSFADNNLLRGIPASFAGRVLKQAASTSFGTQDKYLKIHMMAAASALPITFASYIGKGVASGLLTGSMKMSGSQANYSVEIGARATTSGTTFSLPMKVQVYSSASATLINIASGDLFSFVPVCAVFDFKRVGSEFEVAGNAAFIHSLPVDGTSCLSEVTLNGRAWCPLTATNITGYTFVYLGTPEISNVTSLLKYNSSGPNYMYKDFNTKGTQYDLLNFGVTQLVLHELLTTTQTYYTTGNLFQQIPYSSITDISGVYACHAKAFGNTGDFFQTAVGTMCKFGIYMVEVT